MGSRVTPSSTTDILTYRYKGKLVYVPATPNYNEALEHARAAFPQLKGLCDDALSLSLLAPTREHAPNCIGISPPGWPKVIVHMSRYQIVNVNVSAPQTRARKAVPSVPDITITYADATQAGEAAPSMPDIKSPVKPLTRFGRNFQRSQRHGPQGEYPSSYSYY